MTDTTAKRHASRIAPPAIHTKATDGQWIVPVPD
jgi:hypothetical protein